MADKARENDATAPAGPIAGATAGAAPGTPRRGHRGTDARDAVAEMAARAQEISLEAGSKVAAAMKEIILGAAGLAGFAVESARDLVQYMVRRGQMTPEEGDKLLREAEEGVIRSGRPIHRPAPPAPRPPWTPPAAVPAPAAAPRAAMPASGAPAAGAPSAARPSVKTAATQSKRSAAKAPASAPAKKASASKAAPAKSAKRAKPAKKSAARPAKKAAKPAAKKRAATKSAAKRR